MENGGAQPARKRAVAFMGCSRGALPIRRRDAYPS